MLFNFQRRGQLVVEPSHGEEEVLEAAMEAGAADMQPALDDDGKLLGYKVGAGTMDGLAFSFFVWRGGVGAQHAGGAGRAGGSAMDSTGWGSSGFRVRVGMAGREGMQDL